MAKPVPPQKPGARPPHRTAPAGDQVSVGTAIRIGVVALVLASALGPALRMLGVGEVTVMVVLALAAIPLVGISIIAFTKLWVGIPALIVMAVAPFVPFVVIDVPLVGPVVETTVAAARSSPWAAGYRLSDATLRTDLAATFTTERQGRRGAVFYDTFTVAPVVGPGWQRGEPVTVWALASGRAPPAPWSQPRCCLVRLLGDEKHDEVVDRAARRLALAAVPGRVIGRWVADPAAARTEAWWLFAKILGAACAAWMLACFLVCPPASALSRSQR